MLLASEVLKELEKDYPNDVLEMKGKTHEEVLVYIANLEMIARIKMIIEKGLKNG